MKKLFINLFRLILLVVSVFTGYIFVKKYKNRFLDVSEMSLEEVEQVENEIVQMEKEKIMTEKEFLKHPEVTNNEVRKEAVGEDRTTSILSFREQKILNILKGSKIIEMKDLQRAIKGVTERTLRRDLLQLQKVGLIKKIGNTKSVKYQLLK